MILKAFKKLINSLIIGTFYTMVVMMICLLINSIFN